MFGLDALTVSALLVMAAADGKDLCPARAPTAVNVIPRTEEVTYDYGQTLAQLQGYSMDTVDPYGFHGVSVTQAFMKGNIERKHNVILDYAPVPRYKAVCIWYKDITVELKIDPTIVVAKEMYADRCMREALIGHELKHVRADREIVNKYAKSIGQKLMKDLGSRGFSSGPVPAERAQEVAEKMHYVVNQILELEYRKLEIDRQETQRAVDNLGEYQRVDSLCPAFEARKKKLYADLVR